MTSFSGLGLSLSLVFGFLLLALMAELYYLLWWKKKRITDSTGQIEDQEYGSFFAKELFHFNFWKKTKTPLSADHPINPNNNANHCDDLESGGDAPGKEGHVAADQGGVESELMRLHNLAGPPRFLFTIKEETKEDLESEDGRSRKGSRTRSLSDLMVAAAALDTPFLTPLASPRRLGVGVGPTTMMKNNPLFESAAEAELSRLRSSPPPKFKFLRDAEEKLYRRLLEEAERKRGEGKVVNGEKSECVFALVVKEEGKGNGGNLPVCPSGSSQVLPLPSSPTPLH